MTHKNLSFLFFFFRSGWTDSQHSIFNRVVKILDADRLAKLTLKDTVNEPIKRRVQIGIFVLNCIVLFYVNFISNSFYPTFVNFFSEKSHLTGIVVWESSNGMPNHCSHYYFLLG